MAKRFTETFAVAKRFTKPIYRGKRFTEPLAAAMGSVNLFAAAITSTEFYWLQRQLSQYVASQNIFGLVNIIAAAVGLVNYFPSHLPRQIYRHN